MPRVYDRRPRADDDHNPLKGLLNYEDVDAYTRRAGQQIHDGIFSDAAKSHAGLLRQVFKIQDIIEAMSGVEDGDTSDLGTAWLNHRNDVRATVDRFVTGFFGWIGNGWSNDDADQAVQDAAATIAGLSASVTALQNNQNNQAVGGVSDTVDFTSMPAGSTFGADFNHTRSGGGGHYSIVSGSGAVWSAVNDSDATDAFLYNALQTTTDYQKVWVAFGSAPQWFNSSSAARNEIHGRKDSAGTTYVYAAMEKKKAELGCVVSGSKTVFVTKTTDFSFKANGLYALECGQIGSLRLYRLLEGSSVVLSHLEVGTTAQVGASYRYAGGLGFAKASGLGTVGPGNMWAFALSDNYPATVTGSGAIMSRTDTADVNLASGTNLLPTSFFNSIGANTTDITYDLTNGKFTVSESAWYHLDARIVLDGTVANNLELVVYKGNGGSPTAERVIGTPAGHFQGIQVTGGGDTYHNPDYPNAVAGSCDIFLDVNDFVQLGTRSPSAVTSLLSGDSAGIETFFSIARTGVK